MADQEFKTPRDARDSSLTPEIWSSYNIKTATGTRVEKRSFSLHHFDQVNKCHSMPGTELGSRNTEISNSQSLSSKRSQSNAVFLELYSLVRVTLVKGFHGPNTSGNVQYSVSFWIFFIPILILNLKNFVSLLQHFPNLIHHWATCFGKTHILRWACKC